MNRITYDSHSLAQRLTQVALNDTDRLPVEVATVIEISLAYSFYRVIEGLITMQLSRITEVLDRRYSA